MKRFIALYRFAILTLGLSCASTTHQSLVQQNTIPTSLTSESVPFIHDDISKAFETAKREKKLLFVDIWAPWCHSCLSMKQTVFSKPFLAEFRNQFVFADVDSDKIENAPFIEKYGVSMWPTFYIIDPNNGSVVNLWSGTLTKQETIEFLRESLTISSPNITAADSELHNAYQAQAGGNLDEALSSYQKAITLAASDWKHKTEAHSGIMQILYKQKNPSRCVHYGMDHVEEIESGTASTDFVGLALLCAKNVDNAQERTLLTEQLIRHLEKLIEKLPEDIAIDDRASIWDTLADALETVGRHNDAKAISEKNIRLLEDAATHAQSSEEAMTYDYSRMNAYGRMNQWNKAITMYQTRQLQFPELFEPPARLAQVYLETKQFEQALKSIHRAIELAYGPRKLRYLKMKSTILIELQRHDEAIQTLQEEVQGYKTLPPGLSNALKTKDAELRLNQAQEQFHHDKN